MKTKENGALRRNATFFFLWSDGHEERGTGESAGDAFEKLGHNESEVKEILYYREI